MRLQPSDRPPPPYFTDKGFGRVASNDGGCPASPEKFTHIRPEMAKPAS
jgi:hypothetical protein